MSTQPINTQPIHAYIERCLIQADYRPLIDYLERMGKNWDRDERENYIEELTFSIVESVLERLGAVFTLKDADAALLELWVRLQTTVKDFVFAENHGQKKKPGDVATVLLRLILCQYRPELLT